MFSNTLRRIEIGFCALAAASAVGLHVASSCSARPNSNHVRTSPERVALLEAVEVSAMVGRVTGLPPTSAAAQKPAKRRAALAARRILQLAEQNPSVGHLADKAIVELVQGRAARAIAQLESLLSLSPGDATIAADLSAAHLTAARDMDRPYQRILALEAADRALRADPELAVALFNRAVALEQLRLVPEARAAWARLTRLHPKALHGRYEDHKTLFRPGERVTWRYARYRVLDAVEQGHAGAVRAAVSRYPQPMRLLAEQELLSAWARAFLSENHADAARFLIAVGWIADAQVRTTSDHCLSDAVAAIGRAGRSSERLHSLARGHQLFAEGVISSDSGRYGVAAKKLASASFWLRRGRSPFAYRSELERAHCMYYLSASAATLRALRRMRADIADAPYPSLEARIAWLIGFISYEGGDLPNAIKEYQRSLSIYRRCREAENAAAVETLLAVAFDYLGDTTKAWHYWSQALERQPDIRKPRRLHSLYDTIASSLRPTLPAVALYFQDAVLRVARREPALEQVVALWRRALILNALGRHGEARDDLSRARNLTAQIEDHKVQLDLRADLDIAEALVETPLRPRLAEQRFTSGLMRYEFTDYRYTLARLYGERARVRHILGDDSGAVKDLDAGIVESEFRREGFEDRQLQVAFFDSSLDLYEQMIALQISSGGGHMLAFSYLERRRARQILDLFPQEGELDGKFDDRKPLSVEQIRETLPSSAMLVSYAFIDNELFMFTIRSYPNGGVPVGFARIPAGSVREEIDKVLILLEQRTDAVQMQRLLATLYDRLVRPLRLDSASVDALIVVPDGPLHLLPWSALYDSRSQRHLVEKYTVSIVPSASLYVYCKKRWRALARRPLRRVSFLADPAFDSAIWPSLERLPAAVEDAKMAAAVYEAKGIEVELKADEDATLAAMRLALAGADAVFVGAHTVVDARHPERSRLLLADDRGELSPNVLERLAASRARLVQLDSCDSAMGPLSAGEGALSYTRALLAAGVPAVMGNLWAVEDEVDVLSAEFHAHLGAGLNPGAALQRAQIAMLHSGRSELRLPSYWAAIQLWGAFD